MEGKFAVVSLFRFDIYYGKTPFFSMTGHPVGIVFHLKVRTGTLKRHYFPLQLLLTVHLLFAGNSITDSLLGYTIILPDHWAMDSGDALHPRFSDTTGTYSGMVAIERYDFSTETLYTQADEWTRANFIAYSFVVDADPVSTMLFYDTVTSRGEQLRDRDARHRGVPRHTPFFMIRKVLPRITANMSVLPPGKRPAMRSMRSDHSMR